MNATTNSKLVCFLYLLLRDAIPAGVLEKLVTDIEAKGSFHFPDELMAQYAKNLAERLIERMVISDCCQHEVVVEMTAMGDERHRYICPECNEVIEGEFFGPDTEE